MTARMVSATFVAAVISVVAASGTAHATSDPAQIFPPLPPGFTAEDLDRFFDIVDTAGWFVPIEVEDRTLEALFLEIALLAELGAFPDPPIGELERIHQRYLPMPTTDREELVDVLDAVDLELAAAGARYRDAIGETSARLAAFDLLGDSEWAALEAGTPGTVAGGPYLDTLSQILSWGTTGILVDEGLLGVEMTDLPLALSAIARPDAIDELIQTMQPDTQAPPTNGGAPTSTGADGRSGSTATSTFVLVAALVVAAVAVAVVFSRRRSPDAPASADLSDQHRRLLGASDEQEVGSIAVPEAIRLTGAAVGTILRPTGSGAIRVVGRRDEIVGSRLRQVADAGQPIIGRLDGDPAVGHPSVHVAAVPLISRGATEGVLAVWRPATSFTAETRGVLESIAPLAAAALANTDRLQTERELAYVDDLTALGNRRRLDRDLAAELQAAAQAGRPIAFAMVDVDHFKAYNDTHGHTAGDQVLRQVAATIARNVRECDVVYRYGGEEFSILLPGATAEEARLVAERVRDAVNQTGFAGEDRQPGGSLTVSVGVATLGSSAPDSLKERADAALYDAKSSGRNRVVLA